MSYIMKDRHGTFYIRIVLSDHLARRIGQKEIRRSLGTKSKRNAWKVLPAKYAEVMDVLEGVQRISNKDSNTPMVGDLLTNHINTLTAEGTLKQSINKRKLSVNAFIDYVGNKRVSSITRQDAIDFKQKMVSDGVKSITTMNNYLSELYTFWQKVVVDTYTDKNIFKGLKLKSNKQKHQYRSIFTRDDLDRIFDNLPHREDRYWIPLISYYTGCRLNEASMLAVDDIYKIDDVWCFHIRQVKPYQRLKNLNSERVIPIHPDLIQKGLLEYTQRNTDKLFPMLTESVQISQWFRKYLTSVGITDSSKSFHSFRHTFANTMKQKGVDVNIAAGILGHKTNSITYDVYGKSYDVGVMVDTVNLIDKV